MPGGSSRREQEVAVHSDTQTHAFLGSSRVASSDEGFSTRRARDGTSAHERRRMFFIKGMFHLFFFSLESPVH